MDVFFNRQSAILWVPAVSLFSPTCFLIRMKDFIQWAGHEKQKVSSLLISLSAMYMMSLR